MGPPRWITVDHTELNAAPETQLSERVALARCAAARAQIAPRPLAIAAQRAHRARTAGADPNATNHLPDRCASRS